jgi:type I restriction enzyme, S subunit
VSNVLPQGWEESIIENISIKVFSGGTPDTRNELFWNGKFNWLSSGETRNKYIIVTEKKITQDGVENSSTKLALPNDILIASAGQGNTRGQTAFCMIETYFNQSLINIRINIKRAYPKYIFYNISSRYNELRQLSDGHSIRGSLTTKIINKLPIKFPSDINEQKRIADILSAFDDKIELNNQMNQTLEDMATTLFKEWFIDNESNNWEVRTLSSLGKVITGKTPSTKNKDYWGDGIFFITPTDFKNYKKYAFNSERSLSILGKESSKRIVLPKETILVTCIGSDMGKVVIAQNECISNQQINALIIDNDYLQEYVYQYLKHIYPHLRQIAMGGSTMPIINKSAFENIEIILPPIDLLKKFQDIAFSFNQIIIKNTKENQTLKQQRDTLLPKLMSGEIRV